MARKLLRDELVTMTLELQRIKNELIKVAMVLDMDKDCQAEVVSLKNPIAEMAGVVDMLDKRVSKMDFPE